MLIIFQAVQSDQSIVLIWMSFITNMQLTSPNVDLICLKVNVFFIREIELSIDVKSSQHWGINVENDFNA